MKLWIMLPLIVLSACTYSVDRTISYGEQPVEEPITPPPEPPIMDDEGVNNAFDDSQQDIAPPLLED